MKAGVSPSFFSSVTTEISGKLSRAVWTQDGDNEDSSLDTKKIKYNFLEGRETGKLLKVMSYYLTTENNKPMSTLPFNPHAKADIWVSCFVFY